METRMKNVNGKTIVILLIGVFTVMGTAEGALTFPLQNGDFLDGLNHWDGLPPTIPGVEGSVTWLNEYSSLKGVVWFQESSPDSFLRQAFTLGADASTLDIKGYFLSNTASGSPEYDSFRVFLRDPVTLIPIMTVPGEEFFYAWHNDGMASQVGVSGPFVQSGPYISVDVSPYAGSDALLEFGLFSENVNASTYVLLDEVSVSGGGGGPSPVPAPFGLLLSATGMALVAGFRRRFQ